MTAASVLAGLALSLAVALPAYRKGSLSESGVLGAILVGTAIYAGGGPGWALVLIAFFVSSSGLSHYRQKAKSAALAEAKGGRRDFSQALANGGVAAGVAIASLLFPSPGWAAAFAGSLAAATADTWATEIGTLSPRVVLVTTGRPVPPGTSGGVSWQGTMAGLAATAFIDLLAMSFLDAPPASALVGGMTGMFADSLLGATRQAVFYCPRCGVETEKRRHGCGTRTVGRRGWLWLDNDVVNALGTVVGAIGGGLVWLFINR